MRADSKEFEFIKILKNPKVSKKSVEVYLQQNNVNLDLLDNHGYNSLHYAIKTEKPDIVQYLITVSDQMTSACANINTVTDDKKNDIYLSPMLYALSSVNDSEMAYKIVRVLFKVSDNLNIEGWRRHLIRRRKRLQYHP